MLDVTKNLYFKRLERLSLWPLIGFIGIALVSAIALILILYLVYIPDLLEFLMKQGLSPELLTFIEKSTNNIIVYLGVWIITLIALHFVFVYVIWNVKKLLTELTESCRNR